MLGRLLDIDSPNLAIIFGRTKRRVDELSEALSIRGYSAEGIHGDLTQAKRDSVLRHFREGTTEILVATDVAARGLDIPGVTHVYNFDIPQDPESYVHRVGRTGRAGQSGIATTFVTPREIEHLKLIEQLIKRKIVRKPVPTLIEAMRATAYRDGKIIANRRKRRYTSIQKAGRRIVRRNRFCFPVVRRFKIIDKRAGYDACKYYRRSSVEKQKSRSKPKKPSGSRSASHRKREGKFYKKSKYK